MDACLEGHNFDRAESILLSLVEMSRPHDVTLAVNHYLHKLVDANAGKHIAASSWFQRIKYSINFEPNSVTDAILLKNAYLSGDPTVLASFAATHRPSLFKALSHVEILGVQAVAQIVAALNIDVKDLDSRTSKLLESLKNSRSDVSDAITAVPSRMDGCDADSSDITSFRMDSPIRKDGFDALEPTQSPGLRSVRHVLTALQLNPQDLRFQPLVQEKDVNLSNFTDFFEMSKCLKLEDKEAFEQYLDEINEKRQRNIETRGFEAARMKWKEIFERLAELDQGGGAPKVRLKGLEMLLWKWNQEMIPLIREELQKIDEVLKYKTEKDVPAEVRERIGRNYADRFLYGPYLKLAKLENLPSMTMMELLRLNSGHGSFDGVRAVKAVLDVGSNVELDYRLGVLRKRESEALRGVTGRRNRRAVNIKLRKLDADSNRCSWPNTIRAKIGSLLISLFLKVAKVPVHGVDPLTGKNVLGQVAAFYHTYQYQGGNKVGLLRPHKSVARYLSGETTAASVQPQHLPMLVEPLPWTSWNQGGYIYTQSNIIRSHDAAEQLAYIAEASNRKQLDALYEGLNVLGRTKWTINKDMFRIISRIWNEKKEFLDIPPHVDPHPPLPTPPPRDADPQVRRDYLRECRRLTLLNGALYSQRCDLNYKLDIARAFLGERFYMPHNIDFRGRAYPLSIHLNHLGNDVSRSLLIFWDGRKLGQNGLRWLKIHAANLYGLNKASFDDRVKFIDDSMDEVMKSAEHPLDGGDWWKKAEAPFQLLATCIELKNALSHPNPEEFVSHLTVHQDGSCNGLQHYAALGGDVEGAREVNLARAERPQDVYSRVLEIVRKKVNEDVSAGDELATLVFPNLSRKVVKQTVMTHVYGVTFVGAREQIANRLKEIDSIPAAKVFRLSHYLASKVLEAVRELFESAHLIQKWLGDNATCITRAIDLNCDAMSKNKKPEFMSSVIWTTPLGLPIVQPYRKEKRHQISTELQSVYITDPYAFQGVNSRKQRTAFPPNYIHSLDATHMLMSAVACSKRGICFAAVHDSYWTHAGSVEVLNEELRKCFVRLHSEDLIAQLRTEFKERYSHLVQVVQIPSDHPVSAKIKEVYAKQGYTKNIQLPEQIKLERKRLSQISRNEPCIETSVSVLDGLEDDKLAELFETANQPRVQQIVNLRSTEHEGTGLDTAKKLMEASEDFESEAKRNRNMTVLAPIRIPSVPPRGQFDVNRVLDSPYFFS